MHCAKKEANAKIEMRIFYLEMRSRLKSFLCYRAECDRKQCKTFINVFFSIFALLCITSKDACLWIECVLVSWTVYRPLGRPRYPGHGDVEGQGVSPRKLRGNPSASYHSVMCVVWGPCSLSGARASEIRGHLGHASPKPLSSLQAMVKKKKRWKFSHQP